MQSGQKMSSLPVPPRTPSKHTAADAAASASVPPPTSKLALPTSSHLSSFLHSSLSMSPLAKPPPSPKPYESNLPPPLALPTPLLSPPSLPSSSAFSRSSTAPPSHPNLPPSVTPYRYPYPPSEMKRHSPHQPRPSSADADSIPESDSTTLPSSFDAPFPTAAPSPPSPTTFPTPPLTSSFTLPSLIRLASSTPVPLSDFSYWTDGQVALTAEVAALHCFGAFESEEGVEDDAVRVSNEQLQRLVNSAPQSSNLRHLLLVLSYHLRHLVDLQRKHEARQQHRQRLQAKQLRQQQSAFNPLDVAAPLPSTHPPPIALLPTPSPPTFPAAGHWLLCLMSNVRLLLQTLLERLPCHHRELFFTHLRRRRDLSLNPPHPSPRQADYDGSQSPLPDEPAPLTRSHSCDTWHPPATPEHCIAIPLPPSASPHPTQDRGEDLLRMLLSTLMQAVVHTPVETGTEALHGEVLALMFCLLEAHDGDECEVHGGDEGDDGGLSHRTFIEPLLTLCEQGETGKEAKEGEPSKLAFRLIHALLRHYSMRADKEDREKRTREAKVAKGQGGDNSSTLSRLFIKAMPSLTSLSSLVSASINRSLRFFFPPSSEFLFADRSALLTLWLSYQFGSSASLSSNPLRHVLGHLRDGMDRRGRVGPTVDATDLLSFDALYRSIALTSGREWTCVFLFHLLNVNRAFRSYVIGHEALDDLLLPLLHVLYTRVELTHNWVYMIINCFLVLSQEADFNRAMHTRRVNERVPWFTDTPLHHLSMHDLVLIILLRLLHLNTERGLSSAAYNNALAALANMAAAPTAGVSGGDGSLLGSGPGVDGGVGGALHPYVGYLLVSLFSASCVRMTELLHSTVAAAPSRAIVAVEQIPAAFNAFEAIGALCLDLLIHYALPPQCMGHAPALYYLCTDQARNALLRLQRALDRTRVRVFQHVADEGEGEGKDVDFDLMADLVDMLAAFPSTGPLLTPTLAAGALEGFGAHIRRHLRGVGGGLGGTAPFAFDPLAFRGHYVYEERDNSCGYFWPHFRQFATRMGVGRGVGREGKEGDRRRKEGRRRGKRGQVRRRFVGSCSRSMERTTTTWAGTTAAECCRL